MTTKNNEKVTKSIHNFYCEKCDYGTSKKGNIDKHYATTKHTKTTVLTTNHNVNEAFCSFKKYSCDNCEKKFNDRAGLWRHKKKCSTNIIVAKDDPSDKDSIIMMLLKQNTELIEVIKNGTHHTTNHVSNTNSHNKTFNLQFFLNETCKDAMNIMEFVDSIKLQLSDLEKLGEIGYIEGISDIISSNLKSLDVTQRPIHCTDKKREVLYIKDEDKWEKEPDEKKKVRKAIHVVANKNIQLISKFKEAHPDCVESDSQYSDQYHHIIMESMGGAGDNYVEKENKIIRNILKTVTIDKNEE